MFICGLNFCNVKVFGEMEFWFVFVKIVVIGVMIVGGIVILFFGVKMNGEYVLGLSNFWLYGGFLLYGVGGFVVLFVVVMFVYGGVEIIGIIGGEV